MIAARRLQRGFPDGLIAGEVEDLWEASAAKSARLAHALPQRGAWRVSPGSEVVGRVHRRTVGIALEKKVVAGRRMRVDATVVEINIHDPADSTPTGDGVKVRTRVMKKAAGEAGVTLRDRSRSVKRSILGYRESQTTAR